MIMQGIEYVTGKLRSSEAKQKQDCCEVHWLAIGKTETMVLSLDENIHQPCKVI